MPKYNWKQTEIYKQLEKRKDLKGYVYADKILTLLKNPDVMDTIELILDKGGATPKDFTLHDADHSYRVAEKMWELIPEITKKYLSDYELGLLLLSAYLHDIGMSPNFEKVNKHRNYLVSNEKKGLTELEINDFQKWIDNDDKISSLNIRKEKIVNLNESNYILSYYIRSKHNDWSEEWINENLKHIKLDDYVSWSKDLIKICKSHHYGIDHLIEDNFNPIPIGKNDKIHLRYLSMCLRVADVMENDPERTPEVILNHRLIDQESIIYWLKDRGFNLTRDGDKFTVYARPEHAFLHKAIEETAQWIEDELKLCDELSKKQPLNLSSFRNLYNYQWNIVPYIHRDILPKENSYDYIQGAFKPNTAKILELLGGSQLYGNSIWAFRELIQNSFDAIKERIAYQIINDNKNPKEFLPKLGDLFSIEIKLEKRSDGLWLICKDQGVGMTKKIIEKFFLESGSTKRHEITDLERKCKVMGFNFSRTGQFGIGVLSYFMIANKIIVKTKRELNTAYHDSDSIAWKFEINGSHDFGELSKYNRTISGTEIEMKLRPEIENDIEDWDIQLSSFLKKQVMYTPCSVAFYGLDKQNHQTIQYGWTNKKSDIKQKILNQFNSKIQTKESIENKIISSNENKRQLKIKSNAEEAIMEIPKAIEFLEDEGYIDGLGQYRIFIPYFNLRSGRSFYFLKEHIKSKKHYFQRIMDGYFWLPNFSYINFSLKGIKISAYSKNDNKNDLTSPIIENAYIEINIDSINEKSLSISRHSLLLEENFSDYKKIIDDKVIQLVEKNKKLFDNNYGTLNQKFTHINPKNYFWTFKEIHNNAHVNDILLWKKIEYPLTSVHNYHNDEYSIIKYGDKIVNYIEPIRGYFDNAEYNWIKKIKGDFILGINTSNGITGRSYPVLLKNPINYSKKHAFDFNTILLPSLLNDVFFFKTGYDNYSFDSIYLNKKFICSKYFDIETYNKTRINGINIPQSNLKTEIQCFAFLLYSILNYQEEGWLALCEKKESTIKHIFKKLKLKSFRILERRNLIDVSFNKWTRNFVINDTQYFTNKTELTKHLLVEVKK